MMREIVLYTLAVLIVAMMLRNGTLLRSINSEYFSPIVFGHRIVFRFTRFKDKAAWGLWVK